MSEIRIEMRKTNRKEAKKWKRYLYRPRRSKCLSEMFDITNEKVSNIEPDEMERGRERERHYIEKGEK